MFCSGCRLVVPFAWATLPSDLFSLHSIPAVVHLPRGAFLTSLSKINYLCRGCSFGCHISMLESFPLGSPLLPRGHQGRAPMSRLHLGGRGGSSRRSGPLSVMGYNARNMELYFSPAWDSLFSPFLALPPACVPKCQAWQSFFICPQPRGFIQSPIPTYPGCADSLREEFSTTSGQEAS